MWLVAMTRSDIANAVRTVSRHSFNPTERHWKAVLQLRRYLQGTKGLRLTIERSGLDISVYTDANYAEKADDGRSVSRIVIALGRAVSILF